MNFQSHQSQLYILFGLAGIALVFGMGNAPLFLEEPRRALVAMEMLYNGDYIHTTIHGQPYYNKPPLFNWVIAIGFKLFGYHEWILRAITVVSHLTISAMVYGTGKKYMSATAALLATAFYITGADILYYFSLLGEIDIFFSMLVIAGWFTYFHFGEKKEDTKAFAGLYFFMALAFLTKGLPAMLFAGLTLLVWQWYKKDWKALFSLAHFMGVVIFVVILGLYLFPFVTRGDFDILLQTFWSQSIERTAAESDLLKRIFSLFTFPVALLKDIAPWSLLILLFNRNILKHSFYTNRLFAFSCLIFLANIWVYWVSPDSRSRYLYMYHPLLLLPVGWMYLQHQALPRLQKMVDGVFKTLPYILTVILLAAFFLVPAFLKTEGIWWILPVAFVLAIAALYLSRRAEWSPLYLTVILMLILRIAYGYITGMERKQHSQASKDLEVGRDIAAMVGNQQVFLLDSTRISTTISYYLQRDLGRVVPYRPSARSGDFVILADSALRSGMTVVKQFSYQQNAFSLAKVQ
jgi:4-amino-4-deoxy-L-arabinose transferase-like glycosyltransferase